MAMSVCPSGRRGGTRWSVFGCKAGCTKGAEDGDDTKRGNARFFLARCRNRELGYKRWRPFVRSIQAGRFAPDTTQTLESRVIVLVNLVFFSFSFVELGQLF